MLNNISLASLWKRLAILPGPVGTTVSCAHMVSSLSILARGPNRQNLVVVQRASKQASSQARPDHACLVCPCPFSAARSAAAVDREPTGPLPQVSQGLPVCHHWMWSPPTASLCPAGGLRPKGGISQSHEKWHCDADGHSPSSLAVPKTSAVHDVVRSRYPY